MPVDEFAALLTKIESGQASLSQLSYGYEAQTIQAYLQARDDIQSRMLDLIDSRGGLEGLSARDRWRLTRDTGLIENIEGRLTELGSQHSTIVTQAFTEGGILAQGHLADELGALVGHMNATSGIATPVAALVNFTKLDSTAIELGLGTALNDVSNLTQATKLTLTREITAGVAAGESIRDLTRRVEVLEGVGRTRGEVITRWSTIKGYNLARQASYEVAEQSIPGLSKMWLTQTDERACPHCLAQHGQVVSVSESFDHTLTYASKPPDPYQGFTETPPLHPRCRCSITAWHESWRAYTASTPEELSAEGREKAIEQGFPNASSAGVTGVRPEVGIASEASNALGDMMRGIYVLDDTSGTVRIADGVDIDEARLRLRNAGFRVRTVDGDDRLLRIDWPGGRKVPRMIRSTKLRALSDGRWDDIKRGLLACALD